MAEPVRLITREQYIEMLIDDSFRDASAMEKGFASWCAQRAPFWRQQGRDETWIRLRIAGAQRTRTCHRDFKAQGLTMLQIREQLRLIYADFPELYDLAREQELLRPGLLLYRGNTSDLRQRYTLRILVYETEKKAQAGFCQWRREPKKDPDLPFCEQPDDIRVIRDLSTVEELELYVGMSRYLVDLFATSSPLTNSQITSRMQAYGKHLRSTFITKQGYLPETSSTPYIPVTIDGPQDHDAYYAREYPQDDSPIENEWF